MAQTNLQLERELLSPPGDTIQETIDYYKMSQAELADRLGKTTSKVHDLITGKEPITYNTALQLEKVLGIEAEFWMNREINYRTKLTRLEQLEALEEAKEWLKKQPIKALQKEGYIKGQKQDSSMVKEMLEFYGVVNIDKWESRYIDEYVTASYRKTSAHQDALGSMAAWLRIGELKVQQLQLPPYNKERFKAVLEDVKKLVQLHPSNFAQQLFQLCASAGVGLVYTPSLPKAPVSGATRWFRSNPLIQLTDRYKTNDQFWFTFYHEAGHVILHPKKEIYFEEFDGYKPDAEKEKEADIFAAKHLLPDNFINDVPLQIAEKDILTIAKKYNTHPAIVVGRMQHLGMIKYSFWNKLKLKISLAEIE